MTLANEHDLRNIRRYGRKNHTLLRMKPNKPLPHSARSTEDELRKAAGGKCYDTFLQMVQGWTSTDVDAISTVTQKSPIHMAAWKGNISNVVYFIDTMGCNINRISEMKFSYGKTCLFFALTQSRCDVAEYLLECGAHVKIINNKGQSPLSIASSHFYNDDDQYIVQKIIETEQAQEHVGWMNYRTTHSDDCIYGDLDPRFLRLERPIHPDTDHITPYAVNPTTKAIRRSGLYRKLNNFKFDQKVDEVVSSTNNQHQEACFITTTKRRRNTPIKQLSSDDINLLDTAWNDVKLSFNSKSYSDELTNHICQIVRIHSKLQRAWIPEVVDQLRQIDVDEVVPSAMQALVSESSKIMLSKQERTLMRRVYNYYIDPLCYRQQSEMDRSPSSSYKQQDDDRKRIVDDVIWKNAYEIVKDLHLPQLIAASVAMSTDDSVLSNHASQSQQSQYLSLPYTPIWVDTIQQLRMIRNIIQDISLVAMDAEWHDPDGHNPHTSSESMLSTLQIAIINSVTSTSGLENTHHDATNVWVIDLLVPTRNNDEEYRNTCQTLIREIFETKIVLGFAISNDMKRLEHYCTYFYCPLQQRTAQSSSSSSSLLSSSTKCVLDVQSLWNHCSPQMPGLARCFEDVVSTITTTATGTNQRIVVLSKEYQCSNWSQRPLSPLQLQYAGLDAVIVLYLLSERYRWIGTTFTGTLVT